LYSNTTGGLNSASGLEALLHNTDGYYNTATGTFALKSNTIGNANTGLGFYALQSNTTGGFNTASGANALYSNTTGFGNTASGLYAGSNNDNNDYCTFVGYDANGYASTNYTNSMALGSFSSITASSQVRIGDASITSIGGYQNWSNISDGRFKRNIQENVPGLKFINLLKPITYHLDVDELSRFLGEDKKKDHSKIAGLEGDKKDNAGKALIAEGRKAKAAITTTGFIAQEVEAAAKKINYNFSGVDKPKNEHSLYALRYAEFVVPLVKAVQELSKMNDEKDNEIDALQKQNNDLEKRLEKMEAMVNAQSNSLQQSKPTPISNASLEQNTPNPSNGSTIIRYSIPASTLNAQLMISDAGGQILKKIPLSNKGAGQVTITTGEFAAGSYTYTLIAEGKTIATKHMIIAK
jgi:hypothetical protein